MTNNKEKSTKLDKLVRKAFRFVDNNIVTYEDMRNIIVKKKYVSGHNIAIDGGFTVVNNGFCVFGQSVRLCEL